MVLRISSQLLELEMTGFGIHSNNTSVHTAMVAGPRIEKCVSHGSWSPVTQCLLGRRDLIKDFYHQQYGRLDILNTLRLK